jgi:hypothetical protein
MLFYAINVFEIKQYLSIITIEIFIVYLPTHTFILLYDMARSLPRQIFFCKIT